MKTPADITAKDMLSAMEGANDLEREVLRQALHCSKTSCEWLIATHVYNSIVSKK